MVDVKKLPANVLAALRNRERSDQEIAGMSMREIFSEYCTWHGLIGWSDDLWNAVTALDKIGAALHPSVTVERDLAAAIPDADGPVGIGYRNAVESMALSLAARGVAGPTIDGTIDDALDAYANNDIEVSQDGQYTVIGHDESTRELFVEHVVAESGLSAFAAAVASRPDAEFSVAIAGHVQEGDLGFVFPGESLVSSDTIRDQPDVFGEPAASENSFRP